jgi:hypothetical protein
MREGKFGSQDDDDDDNDDENEKRRWLSGIALH